MLPSKMKRITVFILFYNSSGASVVVSIERIADRSGSTADGETESSSIPIDRKVSISSASAPSSPQMPIQIPALCAFSAAMRIMRSTAG